MGHRRWNGSTGNGMSLKFNGRRQSSIGGTSRMMREYQVRICEGPGVKFPGPTRHEHHPLTMAWKIWFRTGLEINRLRSEGASSAVSQLRRQTMNDNEGTVIKLPVRLILRILPKAARHSG